MSLNTTPARRVPAAIVLEAILEQVNCIKYFGVRTDGTLSWANMPRSYTGL